MSLLDIQPDNMPEILVKDIVKEYWPGEEPMTEDEEDSIDMAIGYGLWGMGVCL